MKTHTVIYSARSRYWARVFEAALRLEGIEAELTDAAVDADISDATTVTPGRPVNIVVDRHDAERARALADEFERYQTSVAGDGPSERQLSDSGLLTKDGDVEIDNAALVDLLDSVRVDAVDWPPCPKCERRRLAVCPHCQTSSSEMPQGDPRYAGRALTELLADEEAEAMGCCGGNSCGSDNTDCGDDASTEHDDHETPPTPLLICPTCDEPFAARYLRHCEWCAHDFGAGIDATAARAVTPMEINTRAVALTLTLVVGMLVVVVYFLGL